MIDKNFYLENLSAFDLLIDVKPEEAKKTIYRIYCVLQRDKIWLSDVAEEDEYTEDDVELLNEVEQELKELDAQYGYNFEQLNEMVQRELKGEPIDDITRTNSLDDETSNPEELEENFNFVEDDNFEGEEEDFEDDELDLIVEAILESAKTRFDYPLFCSIFWDVEPNFIDENLIFAIISEKAQGESIENIAESIELEFLQNGFSIDAEDLIPIIEEKIEELHTEIRLFQIAMRSLNQGAKPQDVLDQIHLFLQQEKGEH